MNTLRQEAAPRHKKGSGTEADSWWRGVRALVLISGARSAIVLCPASRRSYDVAAARLDEDLTVSGQFGQSIDISVMVRTTVAAAWNDSCGEPNCNPLRRAEPVIKRLTVSRSGSARRESGLNCRRWAVLTATDCGGRNLDLRRRRLSPASTVRCRSACRDRRPGARPPRVTVMRIGASRSAGRDTIVCAACIGSEAHVSLSDAEVPLRTRGTSMTSPSATFEVLDDMIALRR